MALIWHEEKQKVRKGKYLGAAAWDLDCGGILKMGRERNNEELSTARKSGMQKASAGISAPMGQWMLDKGPHMAQEVLQSEVCELLLTKPSCAFPAMT
jgi:hypothetical protein